MAPLHTLLTESLTSLIKGSKGEESSSSLAAGAAEQVVLPPKEGLISTEDQSLPILAMSSEFSGIPHVTTQSQSSAEHIKGLASTSNNLSIPNTALGIMQLQFSSQESFNTAVRDLVQENPDTPIGGGYASPLKQFDSLNIDIGCCERKSRLDPLTLHTSYSPKDATKKPLKLHTNRSEDCVNSFSLSETSKSKKVEAKSEASNEMVIASTDPASEPNAGIAFQMLDGTRSRKNTAVGNITQDSIPASIMHSCSLSPTAPETENSCDCIAAVFLENIVTLDGWFSQKKRPEAKTQGQELEVNGAMQTLSFPTDVSNQALAPPTPPNILDEGTKPRLSIKRRVREKVLVTPVLCVVLGRQLGKQTRPVLKILAKTPAGVPVDIKEVIDHASDVTAAVPAPLPM